MRNTAHAETPVEGNSVFVERPNIELDGVATVFAGFCHCSFIESRPHALMAASRIHGNVVDTAKLARTQAGKPLRRQNSACANAHAPPVSLRHQHDLLANLA